MFKIWEKYLLRLFLSTLLFVLFGFYGLYVLIDYSCHTSYIHSGIASPLKHLCVIYSSEFANRLDVFLPFAILIATIKTLTQLNTHNELVALLAGGLPIRRILRPLVIVGLILTALLYLNSQYTIPHAKHTLKAINEERKQYKKQRNNEPHIQHLSLEDESKIVYKTYDTSNKRFSDAYWIPNTDELYHIKHLYPYEKPPRGEGVERFHKKNAKELTKESTFPELTFNTMRFNKKRLMETTTLPEELPIHRLWKKLPSLTGPKSEKQSALMTTFYYKMVTPWLCLLAIIGPAPFCVRYTRTLPVFLIYASFTFIFVTFHLVMESAEVLGKRQVADPLAIIIMPFILFSFPAFWYYYKQ